MKRECLDLFFSPLSDGRQGAFMGRIVAWLFGLSYVLGVSATMVYLTFFDGYRYTAWNWIIAIPCNLISSVIWPVGLLQRWIGFSNTIAGGVAVIAILFVIGCVRGLCAWAFQQRDE
jgi:uncharacterized membrane protein